MFVLKVKDTSGEEYEIFKTKSQIEMDKFTTFYKDENELLEDLFFEEGSKVEIVQTISKDKEPISIPFSNVDTRNVVHNYQKEDFIDKVVFLDKNLIRLFFQNELLKFKTIRSPFDRHKYDLCRVIIGDYRMVDESYFKNLLKKDMSEYFEDFYSSFKNFYRYYTNFYKEKPIFTDEDIFEHEKLVDSIRLKIHEPIEEKEYKPYFEDEISSISYNPLADIDDKISDLDMFLDSKNTNEEDKNRIMHKQIKKL